MNRKTSNIWSHFTAVENTTYAKCNICKKKYSYKTSLTNLKSHMNSSHWIQIYSSKESNEVNEEIEDNPSQISVDQIPSSSHNVPAPLTSTQITPVNPTISTTINVHKRKQTQISAYTPRKMTFDVQQKIDNALLKMFTKDLQPFKIVEDEGFKNFVHLLNPSYKIPNRHTLSKVSIPALYQKCLIETKEMIATEAISGCITTDCWTSRNNAGYIAVTFHFIDNNFLLKSVLLSCLEFSESHTSQNLSQNIKSLIEEWNLENKIIFAVSDNASNIQLALSLLQIKHFGCFAHTLNLIVQGALALESDLLDKVKTIVTFFRKSTLANKKFQIYQTSNGVKEPIKLLQDVSTRWNSSLYMLDRFVVLEDSIRGTLGLLDNSPPGLTSSEWKIIKELVLVLRPFEEATKAVSGSNYMTASMVIVIAQGLINVCDQLLKQNYTSRTDTVINKLINGMKERNRWGNIEKSKTLARCTFLDPRFKDVPLSQSIQQTTKTDIIQLTAAIISSGSLEEQQISNSSTTTETATENKSGFSIWYTIDSKVVQMKPTGTNTSRSIIKVQRYLEDSLQQRNTDALKWWQGNKHNYPYLSQLARKYLCCIGTSVPCERVFSQAGLLISDRRSRLSSKKVEMLLFLNQNM